MSNRKTELNVPEIHESPTSSDPCIEVNINSVDWDEFNKLTDDLFPSDATHSSANSASESSHSQSRSQEEDLLFQSYESDDLYSDASSQSPVHFKMEIESIDSVRSSVEFGWTSSPSNCDARSPLLETTMLACSTTPEQTGNYGRITLRRML